MTSDWPALLDAGDPAGARGATAFPGSNLELAEIEERWGDALFFTGEEGERRMEAYGRVSVKLPAIDPYGKARMGNSAQPHPNFHAVELTAKPAPEPPKSSSPGERQQPEFARIVPSADHWRHYDLASRWREIGKEPAAAFPEGARRAYRWSVDYFVPPGSPPPMWIEVPEANRIASEKSP